MKDAVSFPGKQKEHYVPDVVISVASTISADADRHGLRRESLSSQGIPTDQVMQKNGVTRPGKSAVFCRWARMVCATTTILAATTGCIPGSAQTPAAPATGPAATQLAALRIAAPGPMTGYSRDKFGHGWISQGNSCDTREIVLHQQGKNVKDGKDCKPDSGTWISLYDGVTVTDPAQLDIDHLVPEAEAWRTGAARWSQAERERFANDYSVELVAVTARSNLLEYARVR
jgi:hypothetical protein